MKIFKSVFAFEFKSRLRRREIIIFLIILAIVLFFAQIGKTKYLASVENIKAFQEAENTKVTKFVLYRQYAAFGIQLLFVPSPFSSLYNDYIFDHLISSINTAEKLNIYRSFKGKCYFTAKSVFLTFAGMILLFGVLVSLLYGYDTTRSREYLQLLSDIASSRKVLRWIIVSRIIILNLTFLVLYGIALLSLFIDNINLFQRPFIYLVIVLFFLLSFFFIGGCVIGCLKRSIRGIILGAFYFLSVVFIPFLADIGNEINAANMDSLLKFDLHNLKIIMKKEKELIDKYGSLKSTDPVPADLVNELKEAVKNEHGKIKKRESQMRKHMLKKIKQSQTAAAFFPVLIYISTYKEISSQGDLSFVDFYSYGQKRKGEFIDFYIKKRFPEGKEINPDKVGPVENFVKSNENLFFAKTRLPYGFILGVCLTFFYIIVLLIILYLIFRHHRRVIVKPSIDFEKGNSLFIFCENEKIKNDIFHSYQAQRNASCLDRLTDLSFSGIRTKLFLRLFCRLSGVNENEVLEKLRTMRIADIDTLKVSPEIILKIYAAVMMSKKDLQYLILNDFFKQMTREFERDVTVLLNALLKDGMIVIYLSCDYFNMLESLDEKVSLKGHATIKLPLGKVTLR